jgi:SanA protein
MVWLVLLSLVVIVAIIWGTDRWVSNTTRQQCYANVDSIPANKVGLLLGTSKHIKKGVLNLYYQYRIDAAVALYKAGKIGYILISGDNSTSYYNEPAMMRKDLIDRGIPATKIFLDDAGLRTLDSILRCRDIYGEDHITIISQPFHNERALFIANHKHIVAIAYNARDVSGEFGLKVMIREKFARVKMLSDLLLNTQPYKFYGQKVEIK